MIIKKTLQGVFFYDFPHIVIQIMLRKSVGFQKLEVLLCGGFLQ